MSGYWKGRVYCFDEETLKVEEFTDMNVFLDLYSCDKFHIEKMNDDLEGTDVGEYDNIYSIQVYDPSVRRYIEVWGFGGYYSLKRAEADLDKARLFCYYVDIEDDAEDVFPYPRRTREEAESDKEDYFELKRERELEGMDY